MFLDETGFLLQPIRRRTWAPRGKTPIQRAWDRHDRISTIGAIALSPSRSRLRFHFQTQRRNVRAEDLVGYLRRLHHRLGRPIILIWDRSRPHRKAAKILLAESEWLTIEWLPAYAPELDPCEECWNHTKYSDLADFIPDDIDHLENAVVVSLRELFDNGTLLRSFFAYASLKL